MATLYVSEFSTAAGVARFPISAVQQPPIAEQIVAIGAGSVQCANPFNANTTVIRVHTDSVCSIKIGANPTVVATQNMRMAANQTEYFGIPPNSGWKIAVITNT